MTDKYADGAVWSLSKVGLDNFIDAKYISTPIIYRVDLARTTVQLLDENSAPDMPEHPVPPMTVAELTRITTARGTDLLALVKDVAADRRTTKTGDRVYEITLVDNSVATTGNLATIKVSVFGKTKLKFCRIKSENRWRSSTYRRMSLATETYSRTTLASW